VPQRTTPSGRSPAEANSSLTVDGIRQLYGRQPFRNGHERIDDLAGVVGGRGTDMLRLARRPPSQQLDDDADQTHRGCLLALDQPQGLFLLCQVMAFLGTLQWIVIGVVGVVFGVIGGATGGATGGVIGGAWRTCQMRRARWRLRQRRASRLVLPSRRLRSR
jgi:hypothetical protein